MAGVRSILLFSSLPLLLGQLLCGRGARAVVIPVDAAAGNDSLCVAAQDLHDSTTEYPAGLQWKYLQQTTCVCVAMGFSYGSYIAVVGLLPVACYFLFHFDLRYVRCAGKFVCLFVTTPSQLPVTVSTTCTHLVANCKM